MFLVVVFMFGVGSLYDSAIADGKIPEMVELGRLNPVRYIARFNTTQYLSTTSTDEECWEALQPTLKVLNEMAPHVESWIVDMHQRKKIKFDHSTFGFCATFDLVSRELVIYDSMFKEQDGVKAAIICHEWRHSKQNIYKFFKYVFSIIIKKPKEEIIENDAYLYEKQALISIYGDNKDQLNDSKAIERILEENDAAKRNPNEGQ